MLFFKYNKNVDRHCWQRIIKTKNLFGHSFPTKFNITETKIATAEKMVNRFQKIWEKRGKEISNGLTKIYNHPCPTKFSVFVNTSPYSMDGYPNRYISISKRVKKNQKIATSISHELSHFIFRQYFTKFCHNLGCTKNEIEEIKEILTIINNIEIPGISDRGWPIHSFLRKQVKRQWLINPDIKSIIKYLHKIINRPLKKQPNAT